MRERVSGSELEDTTSEQTTHLSRGIFGTSKADFASETLDSLQTHWATGTRVGLGRGRSTRSKTNLLENAFWVLAVAFNEFLPIPTKVSQEDSGILSLLRRLAVNNKP